MKEIKELILNISGEEYVFKGSSNSGVGKITVSDDYWGTGEIFNDYKNNTAEVASHAEGINNKANGIYSHAEGYGNIVTGYGSHAEGNNNQVLRENSHAEGYNNKVSGQMSHAEGVGTKAEGIISHSEGNDTVASGEYSHAEGFGCIASKNSTHAQNKNTIANVYAQTTIGSYNEEDVSSSSFNAERKAFIIGNSNSLSSRSNAFYVNFNGETHADGEYSSAGADYAECFEWEDKNILNEDRIGLFVTLNKDKIRLATSSDTYILGIISATPTVIGDNPMRWHNKYINDEWGRPIYEDVEVKWFEKEIQEDGTEIDVEKTRIDHIRKINPEYNPKEKYIPRNKRQEWDYVGMMGKLLIKQDGTLTAGSFCKPNAYGIATKAENGYYVMKVINETQALILLK